MNDAQKWMNHSREVEKELEELREAYYRLSKAFAAGLKGVHSANWEEEAEKTRENFLHIDRQNIAERGQE